MTQQLFAICNVYVLHPLLHIFLPTADYRELMLKEEEIQRMKTVIEGLGSGGGGGGGVTGSGVSTSAGGGGGGGSGGVRGGDTSDAFRW